MLLKGQAARLLAIVLCTLPLYVTAQTDDDLIVISQGSDDYVFQLADDGQLEVKNRQTVTYTAERMGGVVQPFVLYGGSVSIDRASATGFSTAQYKSVSPENIFFDDSKVCYFTLDLSRKGKSAMARFERTFHDAKQLTQIYLDDTYFVRHKTVSLTLPDGYRIVERRLTPNISRSTTTNKQGRPTIVYTVTDQPALKNEPLMPHAPTSLPQRDSIIAAATAGCRTDAERIAASLAWVQQNIRYVAYEAGTAAFTPDRPAEVVRKRYGDCKGMSLLLKTLLRAQGFDARLADIGAGGRIDWTADEVPTPAAYNHVICVVFHQADTLFLDATARYAPFGFIPNGLQGRQACVEDGDNCLMLTVPLLPPAASADSLHYDARLTGAALHIKADAQWRGDMKSVVADGYYARRADERRRYAERLLNADDGHRTLSDSQCGDRKRAGPVRRTGPPQRHDGHARRHPQAPERRGNAFPLPHGQGGGPHHT